MLLTPQLIESAAEDITRFWTRSQLPDTDKVKILEMVQEYYESKNEYLHDQYLAALTNRVLVKRNPETSFDAADTDD